MRINRTRQKNAAFACFSFVTVKEIAVQFSYDNKIYKGSLSAITGAGGSMYYLMIRRRYVGQFFYTDAGWVFTTQKGFFPQIAQQLAFYIHKAEIK